MTVLVVGSILTFAYSARFVLGVLGRLGDRRPRTRRAQPPPHRHGRSPVPHSSLTVFTIAAGVAPVIIDELVEAATVAIDAAAHPEHLALWHGFNTALLLSAVIIGVGTVLAIARRQVAAAQSRFHGVDRAGPDRR